ncbi:MULTISPECIES: RNA methyltransferase [Clostridium]|uniref:RNA methyltransferase n=1 Tax=Clostridium faecium TaxID=2762223 RepID=A0ABR8YTE6_9CLOT|nr:MULTISPECIES: RNA methyltransferase [Clostridium]MBD8047542.1 RNA methyltransferase [Clostridium faecium]MDU1348799.1 RNA methyltransferase [Clostridium argentinense]
MSNFKDLKEYTLEEKQKLFLAKYGDKFKFHGKKSKIIDRIISLNKNTKPNPEKLAVIEGIWALNLALKYNIPIKYFAICLEKIHSPESQKLIDDYAHLAEECCILSEKVFNSISEKENSQGVMAVCYLQNKTLDDIFVTNNSIILILDGLEIPGNVGTIIRSADATDIDAIIINNRKTRLNHPKLIRSSMGSCFKVPIVESNFDEIKKWLSKKNFKTIITDTEASTNYYDLNYKGRVAIIMGSEKYGVSKDWYNMDYIGVSIPMLGDCDSLNVGVASTIILYEASLKNKGMIKNRS